MLARSEEELEIEEEKEREEERQQPPRYRHAVVFVCAFIVALLIFFAARESNALLHPKPLPHAPVAASPSRVPAASHATPPRASPRRKHRMSEKERQKEEAKRLNDLKTQEIRAAQEDPTSMFDMSNAR